MKRKLYAVTTDDTGYGIVLKSLDGGKDMKFLQADTDASGSDG